MARVEFDIDPVLHITTDAIGKPGARVFYIQGTGGDQTVTLLVEKFQIQTLAVGMQQFLTEVAERFPDLAQPDQDFQADKMPIAPPVDPLFRVGEFGLGYDQERDRVVLLAREIQAEGQEADDSGVVRFWCTRDQVMNFSRWAVEVISRGRPTCPYCGEPMDADHFCPKKNGHKH
ncbi:MAG: DUF3090 domain-containing protein [Anaerolineae bacterium]|nr:DUF3090 domain-containing protein [Anaerolineae bacterium]